jgi:hypothetical protein
MPVLSKSEVDGILKNMEQNRTASTPTAKQFQKIPDRTATLRSPEISLQKSLPATPTSAQLNKPALFGISGHKFRSDEFNYVGTASAKKNEAESPIQHNESEGLPGTPVLGPAALVRSSSLPSPTVSNDEVRPNLNRSNSIGNSGAAIKAALGSDMFASFRRTSLASVLEKVKTTVGEQLEESSHDRTIFEIVENGPSTFHKQENVFDSASPIFNRHDQSAVRERITQDCEDQETFEAGNHSSLRRIRLQSMCYEVESAEMKMALDRVAQTDSRSKSSSRKIQKVWKFDPIAEIPVRPYSGLKKNADAAKKMNSAITLNSNLDIFDFKSNACGTPRSLSSSLQAIAQEKTRVEDKTKESKTRDRCIMGPGGFWRTSVHSASAEAIQRKMNGTVANFAQVGKICHVCQLVRSKDLRGRCKNCGALNF